MTTPDKTIHSGDLVNYDGFVYEVTESPIGGSPVLSRVPAEDVVVEDVEVSEAKHDVAVVDAHANGT